MALRSLASAFIRLSTCGCTAALLVAACSSDEESGDGPISNGFAQIPLEVDEEAERADSDFAEIAVADLAAVSDAAGLDAPAPGRPEEAIRNWYVELSLGGNDDATDLTVAVPQDSDLVAASPTASAVLYASPHATDRSLSRWTPMSSQHGFARVRHSPTTTA